MNLNTLTTEAQALTAEIRNADTVIVRNPSNIVAVQVVTLQRSAGTVKAHCTCAWAAGGTVCTHIVAAVSALAAQRGNRLGFNDQQHGTAIHAGGQTVWAEVLTVKAEDVQHGLTPL